MLLKKDRGKSAPLKIDVNVQKVVQEFNMRLQDLIDYNEVDTKEKIAIEVILHSLDDYDRNILIGYYDLCDCKASQLAKLFQVSITVITRRIEKIQSIIRKEVNKKMNK